MSKGKILIVEDEFVVAETLRSEIESMGYEVSGMATSGAEALELSREDKPDLALMDIKLQGEMDGVEAAVHLRQELDIPVLFLSAFTDEGFLERAKAAEPLGYMVKPYERRSLRPSIEMAHYKAVTERLLKESESRFRAMFENSPTAYLALDESNRLLDCNTQFCGLLGYAREEVMGSRFIELCPPRTRQLHLERFAEHKDLGPLQIELELVRKDNTLLTVFLEGRIQGDQHRTFQRMHCILHDITERRRLEEERRRSEEALWRQYELQRVLLSTIPAYVYVKDTDRVYLVANKEFSRLCGVAENEIPGKTDYDLFPGTVAEAFREKDMEVIATGEAKLNYEETGTDAQGNRVWFSTSKCPYYSSSGKVAGLVGICINITDRKRAEEERLQYQQRLQQAQKAESLARMAGAIAHNFNNMLGAAIGNLELAMDEVPQGSDAQKCIDDALNASQRAAEISRFMLTYLGQTTGKATPLDLARAVRGACALLSASMPANVRIKAELPSPGPTIRADGAHLAQMLTNVITNAVESIGKEEGEITLAIRTVSEAQVRESKLFPPEWQPKTGEYACISIADTGSGVDPENLDKIFDPFFSTKFAGRGLGLPVVSGLVRAYDGAISVESQPGGGATFKLFFPLADQEREAVPEESAPVSSLAGGGGLVLVVDDEAMVRNMAESMLRRKLGYEVIKACDGSEALEVFGKRKNEICLVLLDLSMPGMNGWEALTAIRALRSDIPVILSSGYDEAQVSRGEHLERPQAFLPKPYGAKELKRALDACLEAARPT